jgi:hypothetical protein
MANGFILNPTPGAGLAKISLGALRVNCHNYINCDGEEA